MLNEPGSEYTHAEVVMAMSDIRKTLPVMKIVNNLSGGKK